MSSISNGSRRTPCARYFLRAFTNSWYRLFTITSHTKHHVTNTYSKYNPHVSSKSQTRLCEPPPNLLSNISSIGKPPPNSHLKHKRPSRNTAHIYKSVVGTHSAYDLHPSSTHPWQQNTNSCQLPIGLGRGLVEVKAMREPVSVWRSVG